MESPSGTTTHRLPTRGLLEDLGWRYDLGEWFLDRFVLRGGLRTLRRRVLDAARLDGAEALLEVGCGTGTMAMAAAERLGSTARVAGIDPAPHQIARARGKARRGGLDIDFRQATIEALPFPDGTFDRALSTLMLHHLPPDLKRQGLAEVMRVLRPGALLVAADFRRAATAGGKGWLEDVPQTLTAAGFIDPVVDEVPFAGVHRGFTGAVIVAARRP